jgi:hypothetical protein
MSDLPTKPPTVESTMPTHPKPQAVKSTPAPKAPPKKDPESGTRDPQSGGMTYRTGSLIWASRLLEHMMSPVHRDEGDHEPGTPAGSMSRVNDPPERK